MRKFIILLISINIILLFSCSQQPKLGEEHTNIILLVPDALRAKQLPCYGYQKIETPMIDNLAKNGVIFKNSFVKQPGTPVSFSNLFSGSWDVSTGLKKNEKTFAQYLKERGYYTVGFVSSRVLWSPEYHEKSFVKNEFNRGFNEYIQDVSLEKYPYHRKSKDTTKDILAWLGENKNFPFFLFAHYMDPHSPHKPSYDAQIELIDKEIGKVIKKLKELSLYDNSLIIFTSDHGESLGDLVTDHASPTGHGWFLYLEQIQVPLIVKFPKNKYIKSVSQIIRNIDIMPTILEYIGAKYDKRQINGKSLLPAIERNKNLGLISYHRATVTRVCPEGSESIIFSERDELFQYIQGQYSDRIRELYNITIDPDERNNLYHDAQYENLVIKSKQLLGKFSKKQKALHKEESSRSSEKIDEKELMALKSLGYIEGGAPAPDIRKSHFIMRKNLGSLGFLNYHDFIRHKRWGSNIRDEYYAIKIITLDNKEYFIIANKNKELFRRRKKGGFKSLNINNVQDIALDRQQATLYILQNNKLKIWEAEAKIKDYTFSGIKKFSSCQGIYIDHYNNIYIFEKDKILKFDKDRNSAGFYNISDMNSNRFAVDDEENIFVAQENKIIKYDNTGIFIKSFGNKDILNGVSSITTDKDNRIWMLEKESPSVIIYDGEGKKITSFKYNSYKFEKRRQAMGQPVPTKQLFICNDKIYIADNWESILVYSLIQTP
jgi:arylsulfatase A-like enzyme